MMWLYILTPVVILSGIAIYFEKRSGAVPADERQLTEKLEEYPPERGMNSFSPF
ncbi:hypothetical protein [Neobacillus cucumis]|uniref:hypothetical protein n=1 Tax=Neobacillus cucumis TaxID=1740721 RepID=UPI0015E0714A|nr:hypothetical protein [Neobacillus cucumis]